MRRVQFIVLFMGAALSCLSHGRNAGAQTGEESLRVLFLGDNGHHEPRARAYQISPVLWRRGIRVDYTEALADLNRETLSAYDALLIYANHTEISPEQESALIDYVETGGGLVALHCASYCFLNSERYVALVGAQFSRHGAGEFTAEITVPNHATMEGIEAFETWDETYVHTKPNPDRRILMTRTDAEGVEPWTWIRTQGDGRVFYTAYGHDERTWGKAGFQRLLEQGIRWAAGRANPVRTELPPFSYREEKIPFYAPGGDRSGDDRGPNAMQLPVGPEESMRHMQVPPGFEVRLFAAEPDIVNPIAMSWDERGRLWIAETVDYPNDPRSEGKGNDRIKICEDTDGDARADKFTIFAEGLSIPTSLLHAAGGLIVHQAPDTLFLRDTDGDDRADERRVLFTGWGTNDTHSGPSNLRLGLDNWIWSTVGYSGFDGEAGGKRHRFGMGLVRFRPDGSELEFVSATTNNTWGLGLGETGDFFISTANNDHSIYAAIPNRYYESVRGWHGRGSATIRDHRQFHPITEGVRQVDWHGGFTAAAGSALYTARAYPSDYWNRVVFVTEPTGHLIHRCLLEPSGSNYLSRDGWNLLASDDEWTAPIAAEVGPDGFVWFIDWYNYIIQHNPTPRGFDTGKGNAYRTNLRDKSHGRIYRLAYPEAGSRPFNLDAATPEQLVAALGHGNMFWRQTAQRLLVERAKLDVVDSLRSMVARGELDAIGNAPAALHGLSTLEGLGVMTPGSPHAAEILSRALDHPAPAVRRRALQMTSGFPSTYSRVESALLDEDPIVRREALLALTDIPPRASAGRAIARLMSRPENLEDRWIPEAATAAAARHDRAFLAAAVHIDLATPSDSPLPKTIRVVASHWVRGLERDRAESMLRSWSGANPQLLAAGLAGLDEGWPKGELSGDSSELGGALLALVDRLPREGLLPAARLARKWGQEDRFAELVRGAVNDSLSRMAREDLTDEERVAAARDAILLEDGPSSRIAALELITPGNSPEFSTGLLRAIGETQDPEAASDILDRFKFFPPRAQRAAINLLLDRADWTGVLLGKIEDRELAPPAFTIVQSQRLVHHPDALIADRAKRILGASGSLADPDRRRIVERYLPVASRRGDLALGRETFRENCSQCHSLHGQGGRNGPDLTGVAGGDRAEILTAVLDPNRSVEGNFRQWHVTLERGETISGRLAEETRTSFVILDSDAESRTVLRENVKEMWMSELSVMPEGFEELSEDRLAGLLEYLTAPGDFVPLSLADSATAVSTRPLFLGTGRGGRGGDSFNALPYWGTTSVDGVPYHVLDPRIDQVKNLIVLHSPRGEISRRMPEHATIRCGYPARAVHMLSGVSGWGYPVIPDSSVSLIVRLHYADGATEDHELRNGVHFADYARQIDVPGSQLAFRVGPRQMRRLSIAPERQTEIAEIEFIKGDDETAPVIMAVTVEVASGDRK